MLCKTNQPFYLWRGILNLMQPHDWIFWKATLGKCTRSPFNYVSAMYAETAIVRTSQACAIGPRVRHARLRPAMTWYRGTDLHHIPPFGKWGTWAFFFIGNLIREGKATQAETNVPQAFVELRYQVNWTWNIKPGKTVFWSQDSGVRWAFWIRNREMQRFFFRNILWFPMIFLIKEFIAR